MIVPYDHVLALAGLLFILGGACAVVRRNLVMMLLGLEIMLNAATVAFVGAALHWGQLDGQAIVLFVMAVAATEVAIGLALIVCHYRDTGTIGPDDL